MKSSMISNRSWMAPLRRRVALLLPLVALSLVACEQGAEGDRCNPDLSHDECNAGLTCQQPLPCVENYCCPVDLSTSTNPYCQGSPSVCPTVDAGEASEDAGEDTSPVTHDDAGGDGGGDATLPNADAGTDANTDAGADANADAGDDGSSDAQTGG